MINYHSSMILFLKCIWVIYGLIMITAFMVCGIIETLKFHLVLEYFQLPTDPQDYVFFQHPCEAFLTWNYSGTCWLSFSIFLVGIISFTIVWLGIVCWFLEKKNTWFYMRYPGCISYKRFLVNMMFFLQSFILGSSLASLFTFLQETEGILYRNINGTTFATPQLNSPITMHTIIKGIFVPLFCIPIITFFAMILFCVMRCWKSPPTIPLNENMITEMSEMSVMNRKTVQAEIDEDECGYAQILPPDRRPPLHISSPIISMI